MCSDMGVALLGSIPLDPSLGRAAEEGRSVLPDHDHDQGQGAGGGGGGEAGPGTAPAAACLPALLGVVRRVVELVEGTGGSGGGGRASKGGTAAEAAGPA